MTRIVIGQLHTESHWFSKLTTARSDFQIGEGSEILSETFTPGFGLAGMLSAAREDNIDVVPSLAARALPGGPVLDEVYVEFRDKILADVRETDIDGICLDLHGAMRSVSISDVEGDLLSAIRRVQPGIPIAIVLDMHAIPTQATCENADIIIGYKTNPHLDTEACGAKCLRALIEIIKKRRRTVRTTIRLPFLMTANDGTNVGPLAEAHKAARTAESEIEQLIDLSIFNSHHFADDPDMGQTLVATTSGPASQQTVAAMTKIAETLWEQRALFHGSFCPVSEALSRACERPEGRPYALGDAGDRTLAGTPGDSTEILAMLAGQCLGFRSFVPVYDPEAVTACWYKEIGSQVSLSVGASMTPGMNAVAISGEIIRHFDGNYVGIGPYANGVYYDMGRSIVLRSAELDILITSKPPATHDRAFFKICDLAVEDYGIIVFKTAMHFKANFEDSCTCIAVDTRGLSSFRPDNYPLKATGPMYPLDDIEGFAITTKSWGQTA